MTLPSFFVEDLNTKTIILEEDTSKHISVLRMQKGEQILLTDGKGKKVQANIIDNSRKKCIVEISSTHIEEERKRKVAIGISLIKNSSRFEWFLEKATEIGVTEIIPLLCERTEKEKFRFGRMKNILNSAMLQSQQCWMPVLHNPTIFFEVIQSNLYQQKFIAHCLPEKKVQLSEAYSPFTIDHSQNSSLILIGPEGDFTQAEIEQALLQNYQPVSLGNTRLRTETAGIVAATLLCNGF
ncbi:MAG: 16S rRNA (uracil(1498)-N(3))-methyltransferase [Bacteroidota bacterium]|nr:16S rRNA (uracil(1498)-N(3))-methyltransferase [Bacteroidota bacterium]